jgi:Zn-dependent protease
MRSLYLGRAFGIPLYVHWTFILLPLYVLYTNREAPLRSILLIEAVVFTVFGCILLHELGHALMARTFRIRTLDITLIPIGGLARLESMGRGAFQEVCIALAGPAVNLVLVFLLAPLVLALFLFAGLAPSFPSLPDEAGFLGTLFTYLAWVCFANLFLMLFNLLPAFPMDGGRVLRALLSIPLGLIPATVVAAGVAIVIAIGMAVVGLTGEHKDPILVLAAGFVVLGGQRELAGLRRLEAQRKQEEQRRALPPLEPLVVLAPAGDPLDPSVPLRPVGIPEPSEPNGRSGFTGFLWDAEAKVWVRWEDGQRMEVF